MLGIIGGTGLYRIAGIEEQENWVVETPFGKPSGPLKVGRWFGQKVAFLPRHGEHHEWLPSEINYRANIWALKSVGAIRIVSVSAAGSLCDQFAPGDLVLPIQYLDFTKGIRSSTFFGQGLVAHVAAANPVCEDLIRQIESVGRHKNIRVHNNGVYACVEGPRLGTRAESHALRTNGGTLVGMTNVPEVFLAREAGLCYATLAIITDYDSWKDSPTDHVNVSEVFALYKNNIRKVIDLLSGIVQTKPNGSQCLCSSALDHAVVTTPESLSEKNREILDFLKRKTNLQ